MAKRADGAATQRTLSGRQADLPPTDDLAAWLTGRLPDDWFAGPPEISVDRDEIVVVGRLEAPSADGDGATRAAAEAGRIRRFREDSRDIRVAVNAEAEHRYGRRVSWGAQAGDARELFTILSVPVMTRLRQAERQVLDTLVDAGVARSRSDALSWCVALVGRNADDWLSELRGAMAAVEKVRSMGPGR